MSCKPLGSADSNRDRDLEGHDDHRPDHLDGVAVDLDVVLEVGKRVESTVDAHEVPLANGTVQAVEPR
eukprot:2837678-Rhodomonas_salina.2